MNRYIKNSFILSLLFLLFSLTFLFIFFNKNSSDLLIEQIQHRQQLSVRVGAKSIENFLNSVGRTSLILANSPNQDILDQFIVSWANYNVSGLIVTNKDGIVVMNSSNQKIRDTGVDLSERDYFKWAKTAKNSEYRVFEPIVSKIAASKGKFIVTVATPIFKDGKFDGVLSIAVLLTDLTDRYLSNIGISDDSRFYLITNNGYIVSSDYPELTHKNINEVFENDFLGKEKVLEILNTELKKRSETKLDIVMPNFDNNFKLESYLISVAPVQISDQLWKVVVSTPQTNLKTFTFGIFNKQIIAIFLITTLFILLTLRISKDSGYKEAVIDEHRKHGIT